MKLFLYYPENDLALAAGKASYTPPPKVMSLRRAGMMLPLWYGNPGDRVCSTGVNDAWFSEIVRRFDIGLDVFDHQYRSEMQLAPWGWSAAVCRLFEQQGVPADALPSAEALEKIRQFSHRRTAATVQGLISAQLPFAIAPAAVECTAVDALPTLLASGRGFIAKLPWSSSGRGQLDSRKCPPEQFLRQAEGMINRQGSFMLEQAYDRVADFAMLFDCDSDGCRFAGYSLFATTPNGQYTGNQLLSDSAIEQRLAQYVDTEKLRAVRQALESALAQVCRGIYSGPIGVDMLVAKTPQGYLLDATVEINFRMTMGRVARSLADRYVAPGVDATFEVTNGPAPADTSVVEDHRLVSGTLLLTPPSPNFNYFVRV